MPEVKPASAAKPAQIAKGALRRLALGKLEPTPENFARAYAEEAGLPAPGLPDKAVAMLERMASRLSDDEALRQQLVDGYREGLGEGPWTRAERALEQLAARPTPWATICERLARGLERGGRQWTAARKKDSLQRVLDGSRMDGMRLQQRLQSLLQAWEADGALDAGVETTAASAEALDGADAPDAGLDPGGAVAADLRAPAAGFATAVPMLESTVQAALTADEPRAVELADALARVAAELEAEGAGPQALAALDEVCHRVRRWLGHRHQLASALGELCRELGESLPELAEDESWAQGQAEAMRVTLADGVNLRGVRTVAGLLQETRLRQRDLRGERDAARDALKAFIHTVLAELGQLAEQTDRFEASVGRHAQAIERADSLTGLAHIVRELLQDSRSVQEVLRRTQTKLNDEHAQAAVLAAKVRELEGELRRLSEEVSTDALTQVANRRGLGQAFDAEAARASRGEGPGLAIGLLDIDNFKRLNDTLGHAAGDQALKALAATVRDRLRPADHVARLGGEEFVVLMPTTDRDEAQRVLTRLQRSLSASLFMHEDKEVFVTFSAGVTQWRQGEPLDAALGRADEALYEAKRSGKNRTCLA